MIEVNSSFYRIPTPATTASWARRVADVPRFVFSAKLNQDFTHRFARDSRLAGDFRRAFEPLREQGRLSCLLAQFRYDFSDGAESRRLLTWLKDEFGLWSPLVVEVRHASWATADAVAFLRALDVTVANLDYPTARDSFDVRTNLVGNTPYLRLHGRNREAWFAGDVAPHEPYNYDYDDREIESLGDRSRALLEGAKTLTIVANNHYRGKAVSAALRLKAELLGQRLPVPPALLETYPNLKRIARRLDRG
jgi:uncharacterized protein YecE (DUF72 family)